MATLIRRWLPAVLGMAVLAVACDDGLGPDRGNARLVVQPSFAEQESSQLDGQDPALRVDNVRVIIIDAAGDTTVDEITEWPLDQDTLQLDLVVEVTGQETFQFVLQGREGESVLFQAVIPALGLDASSLEPVVVQPVLVYAGPEAGIEALDVPAPGAAFVAGDQVTLTAMGTDSGGGQVPDPLVVWTSLDTLAATVDSAGTVRVKHDGSRTATIVGRLAFRTLADTVELPIVPDTVIFRQAPDPIEALAATQVIDIIPLGATGDTVRNLVYDWAIRDTLVLFPNLAFSGPTGAGVYARGNGASWVVASTGPFMDSVLVTVDQRVTAAAPVPTYAFLAIGDTAALTIEPLDANGFTVADADPPLWTSFDPAIVAVDAQGVASALASPMGVSSARVTGEIDSTSYDLWIDVQDGVNVGPAMDVSVGNLHSCWIENINNTVYCRGVGFFGAIGDGTVTDRDTAVAAQNPFATFGDAHVQVTAGGTHTCAVLDTVGGREAFCWGDNRFGQLGDGSLTNQFQAQPVNTAAVGADLAVLDAGGVHTCGLTAAGAAYCWGYNLFGQLGDGNLPVTSVTPSAVAGGHTFTQLAAGWLHTCGLEADGSVWCWGRGEEGQLGVSGVSETGSPVQVNSAATFVQIEAGAAHTCGLTDTGDLLCWGYNSSGQVGAGISGFVVSTPTAINTSLGVTVTDVSLGLIHGCFLAGTGDVYCWGGNDQLQLGQATPRVSRAPIQVPLGFSPTDVDAGGGQTCAVDGNRVICWGGLPRGFLGRDNVPIAGDAAGSRGASSGLPPAFSVR